MNEIVCSIKKGFVVMQIKYKPIYYKRMAKTELSRKKIKALILQVHLNTLEVRGD